MREQGHCSKCGSNVRILVYRRAGSSGSQRPAGDTWLCAVCCGERPEPKERV